MLLLLMNQQIFFLVCTMSGEELACILHYNLCIGFGINRVYCGANIAYIDIFLTCIVFPAATLSTSLQSFRKCECAGILQLL